MSKRNRERKLLWRLGLHKTQTGRTLKPGKKLTGSEIAACKRAIFGKASQ